MPVMKKNDRSIRKWVEENSSISAVATELNLSRPTLYKYMEKFDSGDTSKIRRREVLEYFEQKLASEDDPEFIQRKMDLMNESLHLESKIEYERVQMEKLILYKKRLEDEIRQIEKTQTGDSDCSNELDKKKIDLDVISKEYLIHSQSLNDVECRLNDVYENISKLEHNKYISVDTKQTFKIKSSCFIENGKCMIVHTGDRMTIAAMNGESVEVPVYYRLHLYAKVGNEYAHLGDYPTIPNRNFFIIDDVFFSAHLYYNVVACIEDNGFDEDEDYLRPDGEPNLIELSGSDCTGLCELKQRK